MKQHAAPFRRTVTLFLCCCVGFFTLAGCNENEKSVISNGMVTLGIDTEYTQLSDISSDRIKEIYASESTLENNRVLLDNSALAEKLIPHDSDMRLLLEEDAGYIAVFEIEDKNGCSDICIAKYDKDGNELKRKTYGGGDFDTVSAAKRSSGVGIVISGISQSLDGDLYAYTDASRSPFVACVDSDTLALKWLYPVQSADASYCVTENSVFVSGRAGSENEKKLPIIKLGRDGSVLLKTEPIEQWVDSIAVLADGRLVISSSFDYDGKLMCFDADGKNMSQIPSDSFGELTATDDGGFITVAIRNIKTLPQPAEVSSIWFDTETVVTKYDADFTVEWRKTYDRAKDSIARERVIARSDGSVVILPIKSPAA